MSLDYLIPFAKSHAIQSVVFALEWQGDLTHYALTEIQALHGELKSHFPKIAAQKIQIDIGPKSNTPMPEGGELKAILFQRTGKQGNITNQLNVSSSNCVIIINEYDRWAPTLEAVIRYFKIVLPAILKEKSINLISLQYIDTFVWKDDPVNLNLREVFNENSPFLAKNVFDQQGLWHCHHGYIIEQLPNLEDKGKCLDNINVNTVDNQNDRLIHIVTTHQFTLNAPLRLSSKTYLQSIKEVQDVLHNHNKDILKQLLTNAVCSKIHLDSKTRG